MRQKYPIGLQSFSEIREDNYLYIDKTQLIHQLIESGKYYFLFRPRRFGKSLLINTLSEIYQGNKQLFKGLWIEDKIKWEQHPIIHIGFSSIGYKDYGLENALLKTLDAIAKQYQVTLTEKGLSAKFKELLRTISKERKAVILIDEYDKPIIDYLDDIGQAQQHREVLKNFYSIIKDHDAYIEFLFITGVSKFSKVSIFSDLNHVQDITFHPRYHTICGYTQEDVEHYFANEIESLIEEKKLTRAELLQQIKEWYNGYSWFGTTRLYNPFSVLNFFDTGVFDNYWFDTGSPSFLIKNLSRNERFDFEHLEVGKSAFDSFQLDNISPETLLFQTGYITIKEKDEYDIYHLSYPNKEVKHSLINYLLESYSYTNQGTAKPYIAKISRALVHDDMEELVSLFNTLFASIPHQIFIAKREAYFHSVIFLALHILGYYIQAEISHHKGRLDAVLHLNDKIYVIEFKLDFSAQKALSQIKEKEYAKPYLNGNKKVILLGINLDSELKAIDGWEREELSLPA